MNHFFLFVACILSVEIFIQLKFLFLIDLIHIFTKKVIYTIPNKKISDHWKEKVIPAYSIKISRLSLQILIILLLILSVFYVIGTFLSNFFTLIFSAIGIIESMIFTFGYAYVKKTISG
tara:strand:- start:2984 stop:3340 length:357 start_codon:yes stop_codon:yes gene_type:complete